ncbi:hypothetical protein D3C85_630780 [compost metagenome]
MKLKELEQIINEMKKSFGDNVVENEIYLDMTFGAEILLELGSECITTLCHIPYYEYQDKEE